MLIKYLLFLSLLINVTVGYKILVVNPKFGYSHVNFFSQVSDILVDAGHNVTVLTFEMDPTITHPGSTKANIITYPATPELEDHFVKSISPEFFWKLKSTGTGQIKFIKKLVAAFNELSNKIFHDDNLTEILRKEKFDLGIAESINPFMLGMFKVWGINTYVAGLSMSLFDRNYKDFGMDFPSSYIPTTSSPFNDKMTYVERCQNLFTHVIGRCFAYIYSNKVTLQDEFDKKYGKGFFDKDKVLGDSSFFFLNSNPFIDIPGPKTAKMIEVSGIGIKDMKPLDEYWEEIFSLRPKTILISFGTVAKSKFMPQDMKNGLLETIRRMKDITFIWKYETPKDGTGEGIENLILSKWLPQSDLLNDKRLTLFITHGGLGSTTEVFFRGVPVVAIPILGDQLKNVRLFERHGTGLVMNKEDLSIYSILEEKIKTIINNEEFKKNAELVSKRLKKRPTDPKQLLIKHVEFAAEFGNLEILDLASRNMGFIQYYNLDIIIPLLIALSLLLILIIKVIVKITSYFYTGKIKIE